MASKVVVLRGCDKCQCLITGKDYHTINGLLCEACVTGTPPAQAEPVKGVKSMEEWVEKCINGPAGLRSFIAHEQLGLEPDDMAVAGAGYILRCLVQPHGKEYLDAVVAQSQKLAQLRPLPVTLEEGVGK
jgi:hypothetical protein